MYYIKVGFKGGQNNIPRYVFVMCGEIVKHCNSLLYAVVLELHAVLYHFML